MKRETLLPLLGNFTRREEYPYTLLQRTCHSSFVAQEISYADCDGTSIEATILIPTNLDLEKKHPTIIACHQHANQYEIGMGEPAGLCGNTDNTFALPLLEAGFVVICPEHIGFGRRRVYRDGVAMAGRDGERWLFIQELLIGRTLLGKALEDLYCLFEVMIQLPYVDTERIGIAGHSLGGMMSFLYALYDKRIKAVASSCGIGPLALLQERRINHNLSMYLPGFLNHGDIEELFDLISPTPLYLTFGAHDPIFPTAGSLLLCERAKKAYTQVDHLDALITEVTDDGHGYTDQKQKTSVAFFQRWL